MVPDTEREGGAFDACLRSRGRRVMKVVSRVTTLASMIVLIPRR